MAKFCTSCGSELSPGATFCEECGKPVLAKIAIETPKVETLIKGGEFSTSKPPIQLKPKLIRLLGIGALLLLTAGTGLYFLLREAPLPQADALSELLNKNEAFRLEQTCLNNFDYAKNPVHVANHDSNTKAWLDFLVASGIYSGPEKQIQQRGFFYEELWQYKHAEAAAKAIRGNRLCFATGVTVEKAAFQEVNRSNEQAFVIGKVTYHFADQAAWSKTDEARRLGPDQLAETHELDIFLRLKDGHWEQGKPNGREIAELSGRSRSSSKQTPSPSLLDQLLAVFKSAPEAGLIGKWHVRDSMLPLILEFKADAIILNGMEEEVTYRQDGNMITVSSTTSNAPLMKLEQISSDELKMRQDGISFVLKRDR